MKPNNPFLISGYFSPQFFCDRSQETETMLKALHNGINISLTAYPLSKARLLKAASSVNSALKNLINIELVYKTKDGYIVYDHFMAIWLRQQIFKIKILYWYW